MFPTLLIKHPIYLDSCVGNMFSFRAWLSGKHNVQDQWPEFDSHWGK